MQEQNSKPIKEILVRVLYSYITSSDETSLRDDYVIKNYSFSQFYNIPETAIVGILSIEFMDGSEKHFGADIPLAQAKAWEIIHNEKKRLKVENNCRITPYPERETLKLNEIIATLSTIILTGHTLKQGSMLVIYNKDFHDLLNSLEDKEYWRITGFQGDSFFSTYCLLNSLPIDEHWQINLATEIQLMQFKKDGEKALEERVEKHGTISAPTMQAPPLEELDIKKITPYPEKETSIPTMQPQTETLATKPSHYHPGITFTETAQIQEYVNNNILNSGQYDADTRNRIALWAGMALKHLLRLGLKDDMIIEINKSENYCHRAQFGDWIKRGES